MAALPRKLAALVSAVAVLMAHAACVCHAARAGAEVAAVATVGEHGIPSKAVHACCKHAADKTTDSHPQPAKSQGGCRHCAGSVTATTARPTTDAFAVGIDLHAPAFTLAAIPPVGAPSQTARADSAGALAFPHSCTLLRLHCALNL
jgi:hypothetical protein